MKKVREYLIVLCLFLVCVFSLCFVNLNLPYKVRGQLNNDITYNKDNNEILVNKNSIKILQITDLHLYKSSHMLLTFEIIKKLVYNEKPDLIVITGDIIVSKGTDADVKKLFEFMKDLQIPWAAVFGNHDDEGYYNLDDLSDLYEHAEFSLFKKGDVIDRHGNYFYNVIFKDQNIFQLIFMDSAQSGFSEDSKRFYKDTIESSKSVYNVNILNNFLFCHIPLKEMRTAVELYKEDKTIGIGEIRETVCIQEDDVNFFDLMLEMNATKAMIFGHDHVNNAKIKYKGIELCYGLKSSTASYNDEKFVGGTVYIINSDGSYGYKDIVVY